MTKLSVLDLVRVKQGGDARTALEESRDLAIHLERLGYERIWISEHHNTTGIPSAATKTIPLAAGGIIAR